MYCILFCLIYAFYSMKCILCIVFWTKLLTANKNYVTGTVPAKKNYVTGTVPANKRYVRGTVKKG